jgi:uncharacterized damage-inducible protein DinB
MDVAFPEPTAPRASRTEVFLGYLDYFRERVVDKLEQLPPDDVTRSRLASGWTPLELGVHLQHVERRWLEWGFLGHDVGDPWADEQDDRWQAPPGVGLSEVTDRLRRQGTRSREIIEGHHLDERGQPGPRWRGAEPATLERVLFHLVQEYARHLGQLDVVVELASGTVGE